MPRTVLWRSTDACGRPSTKERMVEAVHDATGGAARVTTVTTPRGTFATPCFMPVGTRGTVKSLAAPDLEALGAEVVLANALHLLLRPGAGIVAELGGPHPLSGWAGHPLTDSGGYQVFSLEPK